MSLIPAISSASSYMGAASNDSSQPTLNKRKKTEEIFKPCFDVELLATSIFSELLDTTGSHRERRVANEMSMMNAEILMQFSVYRPSVIKKVFADYLQASGYELNDRESIGQTVNQLCVISVLNSKYQGTIVELEEKITGFLEASKQERFHEMITSANKLLSAPVGKSLGKLQQLTANLRSMEAEISNAFDLFYYVSDDCQECIDILARETKFQNDALRYPLCREHFAQFCQNLNLLANEKVELLRLQTQIREKQNRVREEMKLLYETQESKEANLPSTEMIPERDRFCNENESLLWTLGGDLLSRVFTATLAYKKSHKEWQFPRGFVPAINKSADLTTNWKKFEFAKLFPSKGSPSFPAFDAPFVWEVFGKYAKIDHLTDLGCFMRQVINELPEESFQKLVGASAENRGKSLEQAFFQKFKKTATFVTLKDWALTLHPLKD